MRVPWFNWRASGRGAAEDVCAPRMRTEDEMYLALRLMPLYRVVLVVDAPDARERLWWPLEWRATLIRLLGAERAQQVLSDAIANGAAVVATCPRELAEHYSEELARRALPCLVEPA